MGIEQHRTEILKELCTNGKHVIAEVYKLLLKFESEEKQVTDCMIKQFKNFGYATQMNQWERKQIKGVKFTLCYNLRDFTK